MIHLAMTTARVSEINDFIQVRATAWSASENLVRDGASIGSDQREPQPCGRWFIVAQSK
jgi:hypothetical protein